MKTNLLERKGHGFPWETTLPNTSTSPVPTGQQKPLFNWPSHGERNSRNTGIPRANALCVSTSPGSVGSCGALSSIHTLQKCSQHFSQALIAPLCIQTRPVIAVPQKFSCPDPLLWLLPRWGTDQEILVAKSQSSSSGQTVQLLSPADDHHSGTGTTTSPKPPGRGTNADLQDSS